MRQVCLVSADFTRAATGTRTGATSFEFQSWNQPHYVVFKIEYHVVGDTWCQPLLSYGNSVWPM